MTPLETIFYLTYLLKNISCMRLCLKILFVNYICDSYLIYHVGQTNLPFKKNFEPKTVILPLGNNNRIFGMCFDFVLAELYFVSSNWNHVHSVCLLHTFFKSRLWYTEYILYTVCCRRDVTHLQSVQEVQRRRRFVVATELTGTQVVEIGGF